MRDILYGGCANFNGSEMDALRNLDLDKSLLDLDKGNFDSLFKNGFPGPSEIVNALANKQGKSVQPVSDTDHCNEDLEKSLGGSVGPGGLDKAVLASYGSLEPKEQGGAFQMACDKCHDGMGLSKLPYEKILKGSKLNDEERSLKDGMAMRLKKCWMPPSEAPMKLTTDVRNKMLKALGIEEAVKCPDDGNPVLK